MQPLSKIAASTARARAVALPPRGGTCHSRSNSYERARVRNFAQFEELRVIDGRRLHSAAWDRVRGASGTGGRTRYRTWPRPAIAPPGATWACRPGLHHHQPRHAVRFETSPPQMRAHRFMVLRYYVKYYPDDFYRCMSENIS